MNLKSAAFIAALLLGATGGAAFAQTGSPVGPPGAAGNPASGMQGGQGGHMHGGKHGHHHGMHGQGMHGGGMMHGLRFPPGYEKLEMEMHAEMMESMARILRKYAAQLPDKPVGTSP